MKTKYLEVFMRIMHCCAILLAATNVHANETRVYERDPIGNIQYHKPSYLIQKDGKIIETNALGEKQHHKQQYQIKNGEIYQTDSIGNIQHHKPMFKIETKK